MPKQEKRRGDPFTLELNFGAGCRVTAAAFSPAAGGGIFSCSVSPVPDDTIAALEQAVRDHRRVRLLFPSAPIVMNIETLERIGPRSVRLAGLVVKDADLA